MDSLTKYVIVVTTFLCVVCVVALVVLDSKRTDQPLHQESAKVESDQGYQDEADKIVSQIRYIKDERTEICFAYILDEQGKIQFFTCVPSNMVQPTLLKIGKTEGKQP